MLLQHLRINLKISFKILRKSETKRRILSNHRKLETHYSNRFSREFRKRIAKTFFCVFERFWMNRWTPWYSISSDNSFISLPITSISFLHIKLLSVRLENNSKNLVYQYIHNTLAQEHKSHRLEKSKKTSHTFLCYSNDQWYPIIRPL